MVILIKKNLPISKSFIYSIKMQGYLFLRDFFLLNSNIVGVCFFKFLNILCYCRHDKLRNHYKEKKLTNQPHPISLIHKKVIHLMNHQFYTISATLGDPQGTSPLILRQEMKKVRNGSLAN